MKNKLIISIVFICTLFVILAFSCFASQNLYQIPSGTSVTIGDYNSAYPNDWELPFPDIRFLEGMTDTGDILMIITINAQYLESFARNNNLTLPEDISIPYPYITKFNIDVSSLDYGSFSNISEFESVCQQILTSLSNNSNADLLAQIDTLNNRITGLNNQITRLNEQIEDLEYESALDSDRIEELTQDLNSARNSLAEARADIEELEDIIDQKDYDYDLLNARFQSTENQLVEALAEIIRLEQELENSQNSTEAYNDGYNQALADYDVFNSGLVSIFSAPMYIVNSIFGFEIFGFNFFTVIQFILSLVLIVWLFEKMR